MDVIAAWGCLVVWLADLFDRFERRFAIDRQRGDLLPDRVLAWGCCDDGRYFFLKLPAYGYEYAAFRDADGWCQYALLYTTWPCWFKKTRWRVIPVFE